MYSYLHTIRSVIFVSAAQTVKILSIVAVPSSFECLIKLMGKVPSNILYFCFMFPMTHSTCILTLAIFLDVSTS